MNKIDMVAYLERLFDPSDVPMPIPHAVQNSPEIRVEDLDIDWRVEYEHRAAIMQFEGGLSRERADFLALQDTIAEMKRRKILS